MFFCSDQRPVYKAKPENKGASVGDLAKVLGAAGMSYQQKIENHTMIRLKKTSRDTKNKKRHTIEEILIRMTGMLLMKNQMKNE